VFLRLFRRDFVNLGMVLKEKYTTLQRTLDCMQTQIEHTTYRHDPPGVELLQSMPTLMHRNFYGIPGAGDCDCFTITTVACCKVENIPVRIVVVGNTTKNPTHVYAEVLDGGRWTAFDLCSPFYGETKKYRYLSIIKVK
jgi:hypothetical protein